MIVREGQKGFIAKNERGCRKPTISKFEPETLSRAVAKGSEFRGMQMQTPAATDFRKWAAQVARQAGEEPDATEAQRLMRIAEYWVRLAEIDAINARRPKQ